MRRMVSRWLTPLIVALIGAGLTLAAWQLQRVQDEEARQLRFDRRVEQAARGMQQRLAEADRLLRALSAFIVASDDVTPQDWEQFHSHLELDHYLPSVRGMGYLKVLPSAAADPARRARVVHQAPRTPGQLSPFPADPMAEPNLREALERTLDTGQVSLSSALPYRDGITTRAVPPMTAAIYLPIYGGAREVQRPEERAAALLGVAYVFLDLGELTTSAVTAADDAVRFEIDDLRHDGDQAPLYRPRQAAPTDTGLARELRIEHGGHAWRMQAFELPEPAAGMSYLWLPHTRASGALLAGLVVTTLVCLLLSLLQNQRRRAVTLARRMSEAWQASESRAATILAQAGEAILTVDEAGRIVDANPAAASLFGLEGADQVRGLALDAVLPMAEGEPLLQRLHQHDGRLMEVRMARATDSQRWLLLSASTTPSASGQHRWVLVARDLTALKQAQAAAQEAGALSQAILESAPLAVIACDREGRVLRANPGSEQLLGYPRNALTGCDLVQTLHLREELDSRGLPLDVERPDGAAGEWTWRRRDGSGVPVMVAYAPLRAADGSVSGLLAFAQDISERKRHEAFIRHLAHHDELTGLPNRTLLAEHAQRVLEQARLKSRCAAVLLIDLDRFKQINDSLGHNAGDVVLCTVATRLKHQVRTNDTVARLGGDEFVVLLDDIGAPQDAENVARELIAALAAPVKIGGSDLIVTPSIGIACSPADGDDLATLLRNADVSMYQAKNRGRNGYAVYTAQMHQASSERLTLESELRQALATESLALHYQPLVDLHDGHIVGVEALLRWQHPQRGFVPPDRFIPIAEETGLIVPLGEWVLRRACTDMHGLARSTGQRLTLAVNLSPRQLRSPGLVELIADCLAETGWPADSLELEITETMVIDNPEASIETMQRLRSMGIGVAIDDFGTGYSSLSYLSRFPLAKLKLDRSFVRGLPDSASDGAIARSVIGLGHGLKLKVLAEGVETEAQADFLRGLGCDLGQGWLFDRPMPLAALAQRLQLALVA